MLIAKAKRKENIIEYILYMYQIEDIIRSLQLEIDQIDQRVIANFDQPQEVKLKIRDWYLGLIKEMQRDGLKRSGHLSSLKSLVNDLQELHTSLLTTYQDIEYQKLYNAARDELITLVKRSGGAALENEIDVALNGMYGLLILRLKQEKVSEETAHAMQRVGKMLAHLALQFKKQEAGELSMNNINKN